MVEVVCRRVSRIVDVRSGSSAAGANSVGHVPDASLVQGLSDNGEGNRLGCEERRATSLCLGLEV